MATADKSSRFTQPGEELFGPPLIGALLRAPWEAVRRRMLERMRENGFDDLDAAHLNVLLYPGPQGARPSELAARLRISKQALNYLLGDLERTGYLVRQPDPDDARSKRIALTPRGRVAGPDDPSCGHRDRRRMGREARAGALRAAARAASRTR